LEAWQHLAVFCWSPKGLKYEVFFSDPTDHVASPCSLGLGDSGHPWPSSLPGERDSSHAQPGIAPPHPPACFGSSGLETPRSVLGTRGGGPASLTLSSLCHWVPLLPSEICITKSSRASKDFLGRARTPVGFSNPSVASRNPAPSFCESPGSCKCNSATAASAPPPGSPRLPLNLCAALGFCSHASHR
jgi:hypothetical protein